MTSVLNVDTIAAKDGTSAATLTKQEASKSWVRFNGGTAVVNDSFNHSTFVDNGTGNYALHYTNAFGNALYCGQATAKEVADTSAVNNNGTFAMLYSYETGRLQMTTVSPDGNTRDGQTSNLTINGDLA